MSPRQALRGLIAKDWGEPQIGGGKMVARVRTVAFQGIEAVPVDVQVMIAPGKVGIQMLKRINFMSYASFQRR